MPASYKHLSNSKQVCVGSVLAKWHGDGRFYKVEVTQVKPDSKEVKVKYEDEYECWTDTKQLHIQLAFDALQDDSIVCCICDDGFSKAPNEIIMCDSCQQGYHISCHDPIIDREASHLDDENVEWICATCKQVLDQSTQLDKQQKPNKQATTPSSSQKRSPNVKSTIKKSTKKTPRLSKKSTSSNEKNNINPPITKDTGARVSPRKKTIGLEIAPMASEQSQVVVSEEAASSANNKELDVEMADSAQIELNEKTNEVTKQLDSISVDVTCKNEVEVDEITEISTTTEKSHSKKKTTLGKDTSSKIEKAPDEVIDIAKALAQKESNITTDDFVNLISGDKDDNTELKSKVTKKGSKASRKLVKKADAY